MKRCIIRHMAREIWEEFLLPFGILFIIDGVIAGIAYGLYWLLEWLGISVLVLPLGVLIFAFLGVLLLLMRGLWTVYQKARQDCEGDR